MERKNAVSFKGEPLTLIGGELKAGDKAPDFKVLDKNLKEKTFEQIKGKISLIASVPSLDTPVCDLQIKRFNDEAAALSKDIKVSFISMDLPFAQKRFCDSFDIKRVQTFSDHMAADFGQKYGVLIKELRLLSRAIFIIDEQGLISYLQYVPEIGAHPDYDKALGELKRLV
jgi:thiol peroxidase